jgi:hypothetical protein
MTEWQMDTELDTLRTSDVNGTSVRCYNTSENVKIIGESGQVESGLWVTRDQAIELIAILSRIVYSKAAEQRAAEPVVSTDNTKGGER